MSSGGRDVADLSVTVDRTARAILAGTWRTASGCRLSRPRLVDHDSRLDCDMIVRCWITCAALLCALAFLAAPGCSQGGGEPVPTHSDLMRGVVSTYSMAQHNLGRPPKSMDELKAIMAPLVKDPERYFRSERDGEEFVVVWGQNLDTAPDDTVVAYERKGVDGKRMIVNRAGDTREVTAEEFAQLKFPKGHTPGG